MSAFPSPEPRDAPSLVDALLAEQRSLSAVEVFARRHDGGALERSAPVYEQRIPVGRAPGPGQQLAFRVDLDACTGCKACVTACHSLNGLAPEETWRDVGLLVGEGDGGGVQQTVTTACHHCEDPACLAGCPVQAYTKDPVTGIVRHLDDQCIGCQYCLLKCPYDVPKYNAALGIVRKCDMCAGRLAEGEAPACVQGCPNGAIAIEIVDGVGTGGARALLPGVGSALPDSTYTRPATRYVTQRRAAGLRPADRDRLAPAPAHDPLAVMLVLLQLSVGTLLFDTLAPALGVANADARPLALALAAVSAALGLGAATLHLGRPLYAFRAFLGWRTSWMSREILSFGAYVPVLLLAAGASGLAQLDAWIPDGWAWTAAAARAALPLLCAAALALGLAGTACSVMIYADTRRPAWSLPRTAARFAGTLLGLGAIGVAAAAALGGRAGADPGGVGLLLGAGLLVFAAKVGSEARRLATRNGDASDAVARGLRLLRGPLRARARLRLGFAALGFLAAASALVSLLGASWSAGAAALLLSAFVSFALGELVERHLFFTSEASFGMPGH